METDIMGYRVQGLNLTLNPKTFPELFFCTTGPACVVFLKTSREFSFNPLQVQYCGTLLFTIHYVHIIHIPIMVI